MNKHLLFFVIFFISCCSGDDPDLIPIDVSWDIFTREFFDATGDGGGNTIAGIPTFPMDIDKVTITSEPNKLRVKFDLNQAPSDEFINENTCRYNVFIEAVEMHGLNEDYDDQTPVPILLMAQFSSCPTFRKCRDEDAGVSYGINYIEPHGIITKLKERDKGQAFSEFREGNSIIFDLDTNDFGSSLAYVQKNSFGSKKDELRELFGEGVHIKNNHGIRFEAECEYLSDFVPNYILSHE